MTGALTCWRDISLQLLEGPEEKVRAAYARNARDDRHMDIVLHAAEPVTARPFGSWAMLHDPGVSGQPPEVGEGDLGSLRAAELRRIFTTLAARAEQGGIA